MDTYCLIKMGIDDIRQRALTTLSSASTAEKDSLHGLIRACDGVLRKVIRTHGYRGGRLEASTTGPAYAELDRVIQQHPQFREALSGPATAE
jgi:hypothetical protein